MEQLRNFTLIKWFRSLAESLFDNLGIILAPAAAATLAGMSFYTLLLSRGWQNASVWVAVIFGASLEAAGFNAFKAFQIDGDYKKPSAYILIIIGIAVGIEGLINHDLEMMAMNIATALTAAVVYWSFSAQSADRLQLEKQIEANNLLEQNGQYIGKDGRVKVRKSTAKASVNSTANAGVIRLKKNGIPPEVAPDIVQLSFSDFSEKYAGKYSVGERSFYNFKKDLQAKAVLNVG